MTKDEGDRSSEPQTSSELFARQRRRNWARLLKKIYEVDPLSCARRGSPREMIAFIEEAKIIRKILWHLGLDERPPRSPPPRLFAHKLASFVASLSPEQAQGLRASSDSVFWDDVPVFGG